MRIWIAALVGLAACAKANGNGTPDAPPPLDAAIDAAHDAAIDAVPDAPPDAPPTLTALAVTATPPELAAGLTTQLAATAAYSDGAHADVTATVTWTSSDPSIATVDATGLVTTHVMGSATITAMVSGTTGTVGLTVDAATVVSLAVTDAPSSPLAKGLTAQLVATGTFTDGTVLDITDRAAWTTTDATVATVTGGLVTAVAGSGMATVTATFETQADAATVVDAAAKPAAVAITSGDIALAEHQRAKLHARLTYTDGTTQDVTATATWSIGSTSVLSLSGSTVDSLANASTTTVSAVASGFTATIHAVVSGSACHPVINEVQSAGTSAGDEWAEIYNPCTVAFNVGGWTLDYRAATTVGSQDTNLLATLAGTLEPGDLRLYVGPAFSGSPALPDGAPWGGANGLLAVDSGALGLRSGTKDTGTLVDAVAYGTINPANPFLEGAAAAALSAGKSVARAAFDGDDTNRNATDFALVSLPTPRQLNNP